MISQKDLWLEGWHLLAAKKYDKAETILLKALNAKDDNPTYRHLTYNALIDLYYRKRDEEEGALEKCMHYCKEDIARLPEFLEYEKREEQREWNYRKTQYSQFGGYEGEHKYFPPQCPSIARLAIIYDKNGQYQEAINLCNLAVGMGLKEGTKGGFQGRMEKLNIKLKEKSG